MVRTKESRNQKYYHYRLSVYSDNKRTKLVSMVMYKTQRELLIELGISRSGCHRLLNGNQLMKDSHMCLTKCYEPVFQQVKLAY